MRDITQDFYMKESSNNGKKLVYFDNASTTFKSKQMIEGINDYYKNYTSNVYRGDYINSEKASMKIDECREYVSLLLNSMSEEIIFTHNCSDSLNLVCNMINLNKNDVVICSDIEHHSNYLPWRNKCQLQVVKTDEFGTLDLKDLEEKLKKYNPKIVSITAVSNITGNIQPIKEMCKLVHKYNSLAVIDGCQYIPHNAIDVKDVDCDFLAFSAHKMTGPTGVGILYGKMEELKKCKIVKFGGGMVDKITEDNIRYKEIPDCFECGTPAIENIIGFSYSLRYLLDIGYKDIEEYMKELDIYMYNKLKELDNIEFIFPISKNHIPIFTFNFKNKTLDIHYVAKVLSDAYNIAVSAGYQCSQPLYNKFNVKGGIRASLYIYNTKDEIDYFIDKIKDFK